MGEQGNQTAQYFVADPHEPGPISVEVPSSYVGGRLILADLCTDFPGAKDLSGRFERSGLGGGRADLLVLRAADTRFVERIDASDELRRHIPEGQPVLCLVGNADAQGRPAVIRPSWATATEHEPTLEDLRAIETLGLLRGRGAILAAPQTHYEVGSGAHVRTYVRLRNALDSSRDCRRIADWLLPSITDGCQVLIAHRGLGVLEATLEARLGKLFKGSVEIHRLPRYDKSEGRNPHVPVSMDADESRDQVIVIGVDTRTGGSRGHGGERERTLDSYGYAGATKLRLVDTTYPDPATEAFAHVPIERHHAFSCTYCDESDWALCGIDPDEEIPTPVAAKRTQLKVSMKGMREDKDFWKIIDKTGAAAVHVDQRYEHPQTRRPRRHRAVDIDVGKLLDDPGFYLKCKEQLALAQPQDCVVLIPDHETAPALKQLAEYTLPPQGTSVHIVPRLDPVQAVGEARLDHDRILLLDDMNVSGATMGWLVGKLKAHFSPERFAQIDLRGFVVLNCAPSDEELKELTGDFIPGDTGEARFKWCHRIPLPHPSEPCPWCAELKLLDETLRSSLEDSHAEFLSGRIGQLQERPLRKLSPVADAPKTLYGTFIGNIKATTAFVRWASALQERRAEVQTPGEGQFPSYYVDAGFVAAQWTDGPQCAGILRTASEKEVRYTSQEGAFERKWQDRSPDMQLAKIAEFGWAALEDKLTGPSAALVMQTLVEKAEEDPAIAAYAALTRGARAAVGSGGKLSPRPRRGLDRGEQIAHRHP